MSSRPVSNCVDIGHKISTFLHIEFNDIIFSRWETSFELKLAFVDAKAFNSFPVPEAQWFIL